MLRHTITLLKPPRDVRIASATTQTDLPQPSEPDSDFAEHGDAAPEHEHRETPQAAADMIRLEQLFAALHDAVTELEERRQQSLEEMQFASVELAVAVASQVTHAALDRNQFGVEQLIRQIVSRLPAGEPISIALHADDLALLQQRASECATAPPLPSSLKLESDSRLSRGSCRAVGPDWNVV